MNRRNLLGAAAVSVAAPALLPRPLLAQQQFSGLLEDDALEALMDQEADEGWDATRGLVDGDQGVPTSWQYWKVVKSARPDPGWAPPEQGVDSAPFVRYATPPVDFQISDEVLRFLIKRGSYEIYKFGDLVLFGIRGAGLQSGQYDSGSWQKSVAAVRKTPDHLTLNCLIGVWDIATKRVRCFSGSTVPEVSYMWRTIHEPKDGRKRQASNLLPTGAYLYTIGTHKQGSATRQLKALRQMGGHFGGAIRNSNICVLRSMGDLTYDAIAGGVSEYWDICQPFDNIHSAYFEPEGRRDLGFVSKYGTVFSSAGCQVIRGAYEKRGNAFANKGTHQWGAYQEAINAPQLADGTPFQYFLWTSEEFALADAAPADFTATYYPLRFGSQGPLVEALQQQLDLRSDGKLGVTTMTRYLSEHRRQTGEWAASHICLPGANGLSYADWG